MAQAGWAPGSEVIGQPIQVTTNGVTNTVFLDAGGQLRIITPGGNTVPGMWTAANGQLCMNVNGVQECVPYSDPFQAGQPKSVTSSAQPRDLACRSDERTTDAGRSSRTGSLSIAHRQPAL